MFDLGAVAAGLRVVWQVEYDKSCQEVLHARANVFEHPAIYGDVRAVGTGRDHTPAYADILVGGFPCQPFSTAGKRAGADDDRNMWPEFARLIGEIRPRAVVLENVRAITASSMGQPAYALTVVGELAAMGYDAQWGIIRAAEVGAPHERARWWCVAYRRDVGNASSQRRQEPRTLENAAPDIHGDAAPHERGGTTIVHATFAADEGMGNARGQPDERRNTQTRGNKRLASPSRKKMGDANGEYALWRAEEAQKPTLSQRGAGVDRRAKRTHRLRQPGLDRTAHGSAYRLDRPRYPAGQGPAQFTDEPPRTLPLSADKRVRARHKARLKALGNGLMPQIAYLLLRGVREYLEAQDQ